MNDECCRCPLCEFESDRTTVYRHLQTSHRKSTVCEELLDRRPSESEWVGERYVESGTAD